MQLHKSTVVYEKYNILRMQDGAPEVERIQSSFDRLKTEIARMS
eukprot:SAG11_NODE_18558_length_487_cov_1.577320_1_plen_44_part_00